jgi:cysteine desulfurase/selenocysteine lyase
MIIGGWNVESPNFIAQREIRYAEGGRKFEPGGYNNVPIAGMQAAIALLAEVGLPKISERILLLVATLKDELAPVDFEFLSPNEESSRSTFLTFRSRRVAAEKLANALAENDVIVSLRVDRADRSWLRVSPHFYNTFAEMERVAELLNRTQRRLIVRQTWLDNGAVAEHRPGLCAQRGFSPLSSTSVSGVKLRWAHRQSLCSVGRFRRVG